jgi:hypothetical protein
MWRLYARLMLRYAIYKVQVDQAEYDSTTSLRPDQHQGGPRASQARHFHSGTVMQRPLETRESRGPALSLSI